MSLRQLVATVRRVSLPPGHGVLAGLLALFALLGTRGNWLAFPLTGPIRGPELGADGCALLIVAALVVWRYSRGAAMLLLGATLAWLLTVPLTMALQQPDWLLRYVTETGDRLQLTRFLLAHDVLNLSPEPALVPIDRIEGVADQLFVGLLALARPWYVASLAVCGLLAVLLARGLPARAGFWSLAVALVVGALWLPSWWALDRSERLGESASRALVAGDGQTALARLQAAWSGNPGRAASLPFWRQVELSSAQAHAGRDDGGPWIAAMTLLLQPVPPDSATAYAAALFRLPESPREIDRPAPGASWTRARQAARDSVRRELHLRLAWRLREQGDDVGALRELQMAWAGPASAAQVLLADILTRQGAWALAVAALNRFDAAVVHPTVRADVACSIGDALSGAGRMLEARRAYLACQDLDDLTNYRVLRALGGT